MIHPTAIIYPGAKVDASVEIGPYAVIGANVTIGARTTVGPHAVIEGWTEIGQDNQIFQFACIGAISQDLKYAGEEAWLRIGDRNKIREFTTLHIGTADGGGETLIGSDNLLMAYTHVAHDCRVGNHVIMANNASLAGHVTVDDHAILGGMSGIHQFSKIGTHALISGGSMVVQDIPPYTIAQGDRAKTVGINLIGLKRRGFSSDALNKIKKAYKLLFRSGLRSEEALERIDAELGDCPEVKVFADFVRNSERGIAR